MELRDLRPLRHPEVYVVAHALAHGLPVSDAAFDRLMPEAARAPSGQFWSPLPIARRLAEWVASLELARVVDLGSGAGKLCVAAALACRARFVGVEHRPHLVAAARELARRFGVAERVTFEARAIADAPLPEADLYYLFNPFGENLHADDHIDEAVPLGPEAFARDVAAVEALLASAPVGTCLAVYNGFGGRVSDAWDLVFHAHDLPNALRLWRKTARQATGATLVSDDD